jgi:uncharacterized protein (DUF1684 family)
MSNEDNYIEQIQEYRAGRESRLKNNERGWLSLTGLFWLEEGNNTFGSDSSNLIQLESNSIPAHAGSFILEKDQVRLQVMEDVRMTSNGQDVKSKILHPDFDENPDFLELGSLIMVILRRGNKSLVRIWDKDAPMRRNFTGLDFYPINPDYRIKARFVPYEQPHTLKIQDVIGSESEAEFPGFVTFTVDGVECRLEAEQIEEGLFFNFHDATNGSETYPGGRFLVAPPPENGDVIVDFNRTYNPPCVFTSYATCPLPPSPNKLPLRIPAGEKIFRQHQ